MKRLRYVTFIILCAFLSPLVTKAQCTDQRMAELNKIAGNVQVSYNYEIIDGDSPNFRLDISNLTGDVYAGYSPYGISERIINTDTENLEALSSGNYDFKIYSNDDECRGQLLLVKSVNVPTFNNYVYFDECKKDSNFKYCKMWSNIGVDEDTFYEEYAKYNNSVVNDEKSKRVSSFNFNYNILIYTVITATILGIIIFIIYKRSLKNEKH